jgi:hypothetical protein
MTKGSIEMKITGKKDRRRAKIRKLPKTPEETSQKEKSQESSFAGISEQRPMALLHGKKI